MGDVVAFQPELGTVAVGLKDAVPTVVRLVKDLLHDHRLPVTYDDDSLPVEDLRDPLLRGTKLDLDVQVPWALDRVREPAGGLHGRTDTSLGQRLQVRLYQRGLQITYVVTDPTA